MTTRRQTDYGRGRALLRLWQLVVLLRDRPYTRQELGAELGVSFRTAYRDLLILEAVPFPVVRQRREDGRVTWSLESMPEWPRRAATPVHQIRPLRYLRSLERAGGLR